VHHFKLSRESSPSNNAYNKFIPSPTLDQAFDFILSMSTNLTSKFILEVGDRTFITTKSTLIHGMKEGSDYFKSRFDLEERMPQDGQTTKCSPQTEPYYLDFDPETFGHILDYLKTGVMPFLWSKEKGFDYLGYAKIETLADYLQIQQLKNWIATSEFKKVVSHSFYVTRYVYGRTNMIEMEHSDSTIVKYTPINGNQLLVFKRDTIIKKSHLLNDSNPR
jgi:hypothetical protein